MLLLQITIWIWSIWMQRTTICYKIHVVCVSVRSVCQIGFIQFFSSIFFVAQFKFLNLELKLDALEFSLVYFENIFKMTYLTCWVFKSSWSLHIIVVILFIYLLFFFCLHFSFNFLVFSYLFDLLSVFIWIGAQMFEIDLEKSWNRKLNLNYDNKI